MRRLIETVLISIAIIVCGDVASGGNQIEGYGE
jgi:hypothetical protein